MIPLISLALLTFASPQDGEKVKAVVDKAVTAHGGTDKLLRMFRWKEKYYFGEGKDGTVRKAELRPPEVWWNGSKDIAAGNADRTDKTYLVWTWTLAPLLEKDSKLDGSIHLWTEFLELERLKEVPGR